MEISNYELFEVPPRWVFLRLETDTGLVGWGEPIVEGHARTTVAAVSEIIDNYLIGKDPLDIERHWQAMYRGRHFRGGPILMSSIAGIDQALWDIKGKHYGAPVYDLIGGRARDRIEVYQWIGGETPAALADAAVTAVEDGYNTLKMAPIGQFRRIDSPGTVSKACERVAAVRDAVGDDIDIAVDFRGRVTKGMAKWAAAEMDEFDAMFYEEPLLPEHFDPFRRSPLTARRRWRRASECTPGGSSNAPSTRDSWISSSPIPHTLAGSRRRRRSPAQQRRRTSRSRFTARWDRSPSRPASNWICRSTMRSRRRRTSTSTRRTKTNISRTSTIRTCSTSKTGM
jgi:hypothetical protein